MKLYVLLNRAFPTLSMSTLRYADSSKWMWDPAKYEYQQKFQDEMKNICGVETHDEYQGLIENLDFSTYTTKDLKADLKAINQAFKSRL